MTRTSTDPLIDLLTRILASTPRLEDAACIGRADLFDPQQDGEPAEAVTYRHRRAAALCFGCPALSECHRWAQSERNPSGVIAGLVPPPRGRPRTSDRPAAAVTVAVAAPAEPGD